MTGSGIDGHGRGPRVSGRQARRFLQAARHRPGPAAATRRPRELQRNGRTVVLRGRRRPARRAAGRGRPDQAVHAARPSARCTAWACGSSCSPATTRAPPGPSARELGIDQVEAGVKPEEKYERCRPCVPAGRVVAMAGDGINDAPALAEADVGIAMGTGTDVAIESAGVTLVKGDLRGIVRALQLSRRTMRNIRQNLFFAFVYNLLGVPIAAGVLYPFFGLLLSPMIAAAAMSLSSVSVVANALRLRRPPLRIGRSWLRPTGKLPAPDG